MKRKNFLRNSIIGLGTLVVAPATVVLKKDHDKTMETGKDDCDLTPRETKGPFPNKTPREMVMANIRSDRKGLPLMINLTIQDKSNDCLPVKGLLVDIWHCDKDGLYSEYGGVFMQPTDLTAEHFLRGRQTTDEKGQVSFISIYPGWYPGRAPHIHIEVLSGSGKSLLITQIAFPESISKQVYESNLYAGHGQPDTSNLGDGIFAGSLDKEMGELRGNMEDGFTLTKTIVVE